MITANEARELSATNCRIAERQRVNTEGLLKACEVAIMDAVSEGVFTTSVHYTHPVDLGRVREELLSLGFNVPFNSGNNSSLFVFGWHKRNDPN